jgi:uncharacterized protein (TIGR02996 family)
MTADEQAFRNAMAAAPDDEAPHRVLADWLDEHGREEEAAYHRRWTVEVRDAERWIAKFAEHAELDYDTVVRAAAKYAETQIETGVGMNFEAGNVWVGKKFWTGPIMNNPVAEAAYAADTRLGAAGRVWADLGDDPGKLLFDMVARATGRVLGPHRGEPFACCEWDEDTKDSYWDLGDESPEP